jgi:hypothetical protein
MANLEEEPRAHHALFKYWMANAVMSSPASAAEDLLSPRALEAVTLAWNQFGTRFPADDRIAPDGMEIRPHGNATVIIRLPAAERGGEAHFLAVAWLTADRDQALVFSLEKSHPPFDDMPGMLVAFTPRGRVNYGPQLTVEQADFAAAVEEIVAPMRKA